MCFLDPCELNNVAFEHPDVVRVMEKTLEIYNSTAITPGNKPIDSRADPKFFDYTWTNWLDYIEPKPTSDILREEQELLNSAKAPYIKEADIEKWLRQSHGQLIFGSK